MAVIALPNVYTTPQAVWDVLSTEGVDLRLDDNSLATGQTITCSSTAASGATSIAVTAIQYALLNGTQLEFYGGGMENIVQVQLSAAAAAAATSLSVVAISAAINTGAQAIDSGVNVATGKRLTEACKWATRRVKLYCCGRYDDSMLATAGSVYGWATIIAARWLAKRRAQAAPQGLEADYEEAMEEMKAVQRGELFIEDIPTRTVDWPAFSNVTVDPAYTVRKVRVESVISEPTPTQYPQAVDWNSVWIFEM